MERNWCRGEVLDPIFYHPSTIGNDNPILKPMNDDNDREESHRLELAEEEGPDLVVREK
jgi:hypothetical protein